MIIFSDFSGTKGRITCSHELFDTCMDNALIETMRQVTEDNCTIPIVMGNDKICRKPDDIKKAFFIARTRMLNEAKDCDSSCKTLLVTIGGKTNYGSGPTKKSKGKGNLKGSKKSKDGTDKSIKGSNEAVNAKKKVKSKKGKGSKLSKVEKANHNLILFFAPKVKKIEEHQLYSILNLVAEAGIIRCFTLEIE